MLKSTSQAKAEKFLTLIYLDLKGILNFLIQYILTSNPQGEWSRVLKTDARFKPTKMSTLPANCRSHPCYRRKFHYVNFSLSRTRSRVIKTRTFGGDRDQYLFYFVYVFFFAASWMSYIFYRKNKENIRTRQRKVKANEDASHYLKMFWSSKQSLLQANTQTVHFLVKEVCDSIVQVMFSLIIDDLVMLPLVEDI